MLCSTKSRSPIAKWLGQADNPSCNGNEGVWIRSDRRYIDILQIESMKLDETKVRYIVLEKKKGTKNAIIAERMDISVRWIQKIWARYKNIKPSQIVYPKPMGRPKKSLPGRLEHSTILYAHKHCYLATTRLKRQIKKATGIDISHNTIYRIL